MLQSPRIRISADHSIKGQEIPTMGSISEDTFTSPPTHPVPNLPYFTPSHAIAPGTPTSIDSNTPTLFRPLHIRNATFKNRIFVAPMCQYSTSPTGETTGALTDYHIATLGHYALKGAALVMIEATAVQPNGRITPHDSGLWAGDTCTAAQQAGVKRVADFCHAQGALCGIQLAHAGRKASTVPPWVAMQLGKGSVRADESVFGWPGDVVAPSGGEGMAWSEDGAGYWPPREMGLGEIEELAKAFAESARLAVQAGGGCD